MSHPLVRTAIACAVVIAPIGALIALAGPLNPPGGPVASTGKTTQEIYDKAGTAETRIPIIVTVASGDADSMYVISQPGSYFLAADFFVGAGKNGIKINNAGANNVTIDLNGFTIRGGPGTLDGIKTTSAAGGTTLRIFNGAITAMGGNGLNVYAQNLDLSHVAVQFSGLNGFTYDGIATTINACTSFWNTGDGFHAGSGANISGCASDFNTGDGFEIGAGRISGCSVNLGSGRGIVATGYCQITDCSVTSTLDGITVSNACTVTRNRVAAGSGHTCIHTTSFSNHIEENDLQGGSIGVLVDSASTNFVVRNTSRGNTTPFTVPASNFLGPVVTTAAGVATASPWANFAY